MTVSLSLKQFFTPAKYSQIMINELSILNPQKVIDLAIGEGSLLIEAKKKWKSSNYYGNDIDFNCCKKITSICPKLHCTNLDVLKYETIDRLVNIIGEVDLCLGNPPFDKIKKTKDIDKILEEFGLLEFNKGKFISSEIPFILQNLKILKNNGILAIILPDGLFTNDSLSYFREFMIKNYDIKKIVELPRNIFKNTSAKTHILILKKNKNSSSRSIMLSDIDGHVIEIEKEAAVYRADFSFYYMSNRTVNKKSKKLGEIAEVFRGISRNRLKKVSDKYVLHTTSLKYNQISNRLQSPHKLTRYSNKLGRAGDIALARVGTSIVGKIRKIENGFFIPTDCIFIIRPKTEFSDIVYKFLSSEEGQRLIHATTKGVAAKHITLNDLKNLPICTEGGQNV